MQHHFEIAACTADSSRQPRAPGQDDTDWISLLYLINAWSHAVDLAASVVEYCCLEGQRSIVVLLR